MFTKLKVKDWLKGGSNWEDNLPRFLNHFYDPTTGKGLYLGIQNNSSLAWGKDILMNSWNWVSARSYYYTALTQTNTYNREVNLANTFRSMGQIMHLVEDLASPAHVRNDPHNFPPYVKQQVDMYELYTRDKAKKNALQYDVYPAVDISTFNSFDSFWSNGGKGLAEFTNRNFLSRDTNIDDNKYPLPMPIGEWVTTETVTDSKLGPIQVQVKYLQGYATDSYRPDKSAPINRLAAYSYFDYEMQKYNVNKRVYTLNNFVHQEYAQFLIPRAVGYSAGLLNYFFHGKLEITPPDQQVYGVIDGSIIPQQFATIKAKVKNATPNEAISTGSLVAIAGYKIDPDYAPDISNNPTANALAPFAYSVSAPVTISPAKLATINSTPTEFTFDFSSSKIPAGVTDLTLQVVFKGSLGNETDNAVAVGMRNVSEPTHHVFWNASDMFSLDNQLKTAVEIKATPLLAERVDNNHNGIYNESGEAYIDPYSMNFEVAYSTTSSTSTITPTLVTATLPAGRHMRLVGIFDQEVPNYLKLLYSGAGIGSASYFVTGISGAVAQNGASTTAIAAFRYWNNAGAHVPVRQHYNVAIISCKPLSVRADGSTFCAYPEEQAIAADKNPYPVGTIAVP